MYSCRLILVSSVSFRSIQYLSFIMPIFAWNVPLVSFIFLKRSRVFPVLLFSSISLHFSLKKAFLSFLAILWNSAFRQIYLYSFSFVFHFSSFLSSLKASSDNHFALLHTYVSWGWFWSPPPVQCYEHLSLFLQALCLSDLIPWIFLSFWLYNCKGFDLIISKWPSI